MDAKLQILSCCAAGGDTKFYDLSFLNYMMEIKKYKKGIILTMMALAAAGAVLYVLWTAGAFLPGWAVWEETDIFDASGRYEISLTGKTVAVFSGEEEIWRSPEDVKVQQVMSADIDRDGKDELVLVCWKRGRYGEHRPFWVKTDEKHWSQHIFVYEYSEREIGPKWMSSYIGQNVRSMASCRNMGGECWLILTDPGDEKSYWRWGSWGFEKEDAAVTFTVFGDNMIHAPIYTYGLNHGGDFDFLYEHVKNKIEESDIAVINQETPLVDDPGEYGDYPRFGTPMRVGAAIVNAGFDVVTCATNHALDRGAKGIHTTKEYFAQHDVLCLGIQTAEEPERKPYEIIRRKGAKFALFNYTYGTNGNPLPDGYPHTVHLLGDEAQIRADIEKAAAEADFVVVFVHWGTENNAEVDAFQQKWTAVFHDAGADAVVGSHPHILQPCEMLERDDGRKMLVYYSLGNFVSAQPEKSCEKGGMASFTVCPGSDGYEITAYDLTPLRIIWQEGGGYTTVFSDEMKSR